MNIVGSNPTLSVITFEVYENNMTELRNPGDVNFIAPAVALRGGSYRFSAFWGEWRFLEEEYKLEDYSYDDPYDDRREGFYERFLEVFAMEFYVSWPISHISKLHFYAAHIWYNSNLRWYGFIGQPRVPREKRPQYTPYYSILDRHGNIVAQPLLTSREVAGHDLNFILSPSLLPRLEDPREMHENLYDSDHVLPARSGFFFAGDNVRYAPRQLICERAMLDRELDAISLIGDLEWLVGQVYRTSLYAAGLRFDLVAGLHVGPGEEMQLVRRQVMLDFEEQLRQEVLFAWQTDVTERNNYDLWLWRWVGLWNLEEAFKFFMARHEKKAVGEISGFVQPRSHYSHNPLPKELALKRQEVYADVRYHYPVKDPRVMPEIMDAPDAMREYVLRDDPELYVNPREARHFLQAYERLEEDEHDMVLEGRGRHDLWDGHTSYGSQYKSIRAYSAMTFVLLNLFICAYPYFLLRRHCPDLIPYVDSFIVLYGITAFYGQPLRSLLLNLSSKRPLRHRLQVRQPFSMYLERLNRVGFRARYILTLASAIALFFRGLFLILYRQVLIYITLVGATSPLVEWLIGQVREFKQMLAFVWSLIIPQFIYIMRVIGRLWFDFSIYRTKRVTNYYWYFIPYESFMHWFLLYFPIPIPLEIRQRILETVKAKAAAKIREARQDYKDTMSEIARKYDDKYVETYELYWDQADLREHEALTRKELLVARLKRAYEDFLLDFYFEIQLPVYRRYFMVVGRLQKRLKRRRLRREGPVGSYFRFWRFGQWARDAWRDRRRMLRKLRVRNNWEDLKTIIVERYFTQEDNMEYNRKYPWLFFNEAGIVPKKKRKKILRRAEAYASSDLRWYQLLAQDNLAFFSGTDVRLQQFRQPDLMLGWQHEQPRSGGSLLRSSMFRPSERNLGLDDPAEQIAFSYDAFNIVSANFIYKYGRIQWDLLLRQHMIFYYNNVWRLIPHTFFENDLCTDIRLLYFEPAKRIWTKPFSYEMEVGQLVYPQLFDKEQENLLTRHFFSFISYVATLESFEHYLKPDSRPFWSAWQNYVWCHRYLTSQQTFTLFARILERYIHLRLEQLGFRALVEHKRAFFTSQFRTLGYLRRSGFIFWQFLAFFSQQTNRPLLLVEKRPEPFERPASHL